jgi:hypothetical protein
MPIHEVVRRAGEERPREARCIDEEIEAAIQTSGRITPYPSLSTTEEIDTYNPDADGGAPILEHKIMAYNSRHVIETEILSGLDWAGNPFSVELSTRGHHKDEINDIGFELDRTRDGRVEYVSFAYTEPGQEVDLYVSPAARIKAALRAALRRPLPQQ